MKKTINEEKERIIELMTQHGGGGYGQSPEPEKKV